jgi:SAM-dependent methyltransferase
MTWSGWLWWIKSKLYNILRPGFILKDENEALFSMLQQVIGDSVKKVLDIGTGTGNSYRLLNRFSVYKVGLDTSLAMLYQNSEKRGLVNGDILTVPFREGTFNLVVCIGVSEYLPDLCTLLKAIKSLLTERGYLVISISPNTVLNLLRSLSGHRLYLRDDKQMKLAAADQRFEFIKKDKTRMQHQYLLQKNISLE